MHSSTIIWSQARKQRRKATGNILNCVPTVLTCLSMMLRNVTARGRTDSLATQPPEQWDLTDSVHSSADAIGLSVTHDSERVSDKTTDMSFLYSLRHVNR
jgi:hypothetical protein